MPDSSPQSHIVNGATARSPFRILPPRVELEREYCFPMSPYVASWTHLSPNPRGGVVTHVHFRAFICKSVGGIVTRALVGDAIVELQLAECTHMTGHRRLQTLQALAGCGTLARHQMYPLQLRDTRADRPH